MMFELVGASGRRTMIRSSVGQAGSPQGTGSPLERVTMTATSGLAVRCGLPACPTVLLCAIGLALAADTPTTIQLVRIEPGSFEMGLNEPVPVELVKGTSGASYDRPAADGD